MAIALKIKGLFGRFDYDLKFDSDIKILTGLNGYGKTSILKILQAISDNNLIFLSDLVYSEIEYFDDSISFLIRKTDKELILKCADNTPPKKIPLQSTKQIFDKYIKDNPSFYRASEYYIVDRRDGETITIDDLVSRRIYDDSMLEEQLASKKNDSKKQLPMIKYNIYSIREQRLYNIKRGLIYNPFRREFNYRNYEDNPLSFLETIEAYSYELQHALKDVMAKNASVSQELDSTFPQRLFEEHTKISQEEFEKHFKEIQDFQEKLTKYSIQKSVSDKPTTYRDENAVALNVYINDTEKKLKGYRSIVNKLELFTSILNERRFAFKKIKISLEHGIEIRSQDDKSIPLTSLSSGEKQEVILLYELLFKVKQNSLILIDEPEISLHVAWQTRFLQDLAEILKSNGGQAIIATHSPYVINEQWEKAIDLTEQYAESHSEVTE